MPQRRAARRLQRLQFPVAELAFLSVLFGAIRAAVRSYTAAASRFRLREELFLEMAMARTYRSSVWPWAQTGVVAVVAGLALARGARSLVRSMRDWEHRQEIREMRQMGGEAVFLMATPIDATPVEDGADSTRRRLTPWPLRLLGGVVDALWLPRLGACVGYLLPLLNLLDFGEISISLYPHGLGVPPSEPIVDFMQNTLKMQHLHNAYLKSGYYFLIVWFLFIQLAVRNKAAPFLVRFHSSQAILISMLLGVPQQVFFAVLNPWEAGLIVQTIMYHSIVSIFLLALALIAWCCAKALRKQATELPLISEAAVMWAGRG